MPFDASFMDKNKKKHDSSCSPRKEMSDQSFLFCRMSFLHQTLSLSLQKGKTHSCHSFLSLRLDFWSPGNVFPWLLLSRHFLWEHGLSLFILCIHVDPYQRSLKQREKERERGNVSDMGLKSQVISSGSKERGDHDEDSVMIMQDHESRGGRGRMKIYYEWRGRRSISWLKHKSQQDLKREEGI